MILSNFREEVGKALMLSPHEVFRLISRAPHAYKVYRIAKKSGGLRTIAQPARETKVLQSWLMSEVFDALPIHSCATAYKVGSSIKKNAEIHSGNQYISKFDFKDFFSSIMFEDLSRFMLVAFKDKYSESDIADIARVSCIRYKGSVKLCLSVGAPSSPLLSNVIMHSFDEQVFEWCNAKGVAYSRYADDLAFSTNIKGISSDIQPMLLSVLEKLDFPKLALNEKKTVHVSKKFQRRITGVVINNDGELSLGRSRKREVSAMIHKYSHSLLIKEDIYRLQGLLGFANDVEPTFVFSMVKKYGAVVVSNIFNERKIQ